MEILKYGQIKIKEQTMPQAGDIKYCDILGGRKTNAAFVYVPPSAFWMGDKEQTENPVHLVAVSKGFWLQQTELTEAQYNHLTGEKPSTSKIPKFGISWDDVAASVKGKSLRMPTEAEWELAARAGVGHKYQWSGSNIANNVAWTHDNSDNETHLVAHLKSNSVGLFDMSGNVKEWCNDWYEVLTSIPQFDPSGSASGSGRVVRGGDYYYDPQYARVAHRLISATDDGHSNLYGVRLIWEI